MRFNIVHWGMLVVIVALLVCLVKDKFDATRYARLQVEFQSLSRQAASLERQLQACERNQSETSD